MNNLNKIPIKSLVIQENNRLIIIKNIAKKGTSLFLKSFLIALMLTILNMII